MFETIIFWLLAAGTILGALAVVLPTRETRPLRALTGLVGFLFCIAGLYVLLAAHYIAALQVVVYGLPIFLLLAMAIMLLDLEGNEGEGHFTVAKILGVFAISAVFAKSLRVLAGSTPAAVVADLNSASHQEYGSSDAIVSFLLNDFLLPFELTSILLFVAIIGAVNLARHRDHATT